MCRGGTRGPATRQQHGITEEREPLDAGAFADDPAVVLLIDPESGSIVDASPGACAWYGWGRDELLSMNIAAINTLRHERVLDEMAAAQARRRGMFSFTHRRADGALCDVEVVSVPVEVGGRVLLRSLVEDVRERTLAEGDRERTLAERQLHETTAFLSALLESIPDIVFFKDLGGHYLVCNSAHASFLGRDVADVIGRTDGELFGGQTADHFREGDALVLAAGESLQREEWVTRHDGARVLIDMHKASLRNASGDVIGVVGVGRDVTERRRAETQLRESETRLRDFAFSTAQWLWEVDERGVYTYSSQRADDFFGHSRGDVIGKTPFDFMQPEEAERVGALFAQIAADKARIVDLENWNVAEDGTRFCLLTNGVPLLDEDGNLTGYRGADMDITERKRAEEALRQLTERLTLATHAGGVGVWERDIVSGALYWDERMFAMHGIEPVPAPSVELAELARVSVHPDDRERVAALFREALQEDTDADVDMRVVWPDGSVHTIRTIAHVQRDASGRPVRIIGTSRDITTYRETETELRRLREEEALHQREQAVRAAVTAERSRLARELHDSVTQALFAASLRGEEIQRLAGELAPQTAEALDDLVLLTRGALAEMRGLLLELRPEALQAAPLPDLLRQLVAAAEARARVTVSLTTTGDARPPEDVKLAFYRVAQESLNNVARHAQASRAWVDLRCAGDTLRLVVGDDGRGLGPASTGAGRLGLQIMRERAGAAGARLRIESTPDGGTVVTLEWPERTGANADE